MKYLIIFFSALAAATGTAFLAGYCMQRRAQAAAAQLTTPTTSGQPLSGCPLINGQPVCNTAPTPAAPATVPAATTIDTTATSNANIINQTAAAAQQATPTK